MAYWLTSLTQSCLQHYRFRLCPIHAQLLKGQLHRIIGWVDLALIHSRQPPPNLLTLWAAEMHSEPVRQIQVTTHFDALVRQPRAAPASTRRGA